MGKASSKQDLTPEDFDELVESTNLTSAEIDDWYQKFRHEFPKGHIGRHEFKSVYERLFPYGDADRFCGHVFRVYDADGNGVVSFVELLTTLQVFADGCPEEKLRAMFRMYDIDRNGFVTVDEITKILAVSRCYRRHVRLAVVLFSPPFVCLLFVSRITQKLCVDFQGILGMR